MKRYIVMNPSYVELKTFGESHGGKPRDNILELYLNWMSKERGWEVVSVSLLPEYTNIVFSTSTSK